jgi:uncharacterized protein YkwD
MKATAAAWAALGLVTLAAIAADGGPAAAACSDARLAEQAVVRLNALRATGLSCGGTPMPPASPLSWSDTLARAAAAHAQDMAQRGQMAHAGSDGSQGGERLLRAGYDWQEWAENLGVGTRSVDLLMRLWAASPKHCENLMQPGLQQMGMACAEGRDHRPYWSMTLATPRGALPRR